MKDLKEFLRKLKIKPNNINYYERALTHSSFAHENNVNDYERLEFLGDVVLELLVTEHLFNEMTESDEGLMTKKRAQAVCEEALYYYSKKINLEKYIRLGKGELQKGASAAIISDVYEALLGAIYLDKGLNFTRKIFNKIILPYINETIAIKDYKSQLQEYLQSDKKTLSYKVIGEEGPAHNKEFISAVYLEGKILLGKGRGKSKKEAEQNAAKQALMKGSYKND